MFNREILTVRRTLRFAPQRQRKIPGFVHMSSQSDFMVRNSAKSLASDPEEGLSSVQMQTLRSTAPPTYEMLLDDSMSLQTKAFRFLAWRLSSECEKKRNFFYAKQLKNSQAKLVKVS